MKGPYNLDEKNIDNNVTQTSAGNYALGHTDDEKVFRVNYVGRSDNNVNKRLKDWVDSYKNFKFSYAKSAKDAFEKECENYHDFGGQKELDNKIHPSRPDNSSWKCPRCKYFDK